MGWDFQGISWTRWRARGTCFSSLWNGDARWDLRTSLNMCTFESRTWALRPHLDTAQAATSYVWCIDFVCTNSSLDWSMWHRGKYAQIGRGGCSGFNIWMDGQRCQKHFRFPNLPAKTASFQEKHLREVRTARFASEKIPGVTLAFIKQDFRSSLCSSTCSW